MDKRSSLESKDDYADSILSEQEAEQLLLDNPVRIEIIVELAKKKRSFTKEELEQINRILKK